MKVYDALLRDGKTKRAAAGQSIPGETMNDMPPLNHPEAHVMRWTELELDAIHAYARKYAREYAATALIALADMTAERDALRTDKTLLQDAAQDALNLLRDMPGWGAAKNILNMALHQTQATKT